MVGVQEVEQTSKWGSAKKANMCGGVMTVRSRHSTPLLFLILSSQVGTCFFFHRCTVSVDVVYESAPVSRGSLCLCECDLHARFATHPRRRHHVKPVRVSTVPVSGKRL